MILLDTCILVGVIRQDERMLGWMARRAKAVLHTSAISVMELYQGAQTRKDEAEVEQALSACVVLQIDAVIAARAGALYRRYAPSHGLDAFDALIAATAQVTKLPLVTLNAKHFPMIARLEQP